MNAREAYGGLALERAANETTGRVVHMRFRGDGSSPAIGDRSTRPTALVLLGVLACVTALQPRLAAAAGESAVITGDSRVGGYLHCLPSDEPGARAVGLPVTWLRDGQPVAEAVVPTFPLVDDDLGHAISCVLGRGAVSAAVVVTAVAPAFDGGPSAQFRENGDGSVSCNPGRIIGEPQPAATYEWLVDQVPVGVTGDRFAPSPSTPLGSVTCRVTLTNAAGSVSATTTAPMRSVVIESIVPRRFVARASIFPRPVTRSFYVTPWRRLDDRGRLRLDVACESPRHAPCRLRIIVREARAASLLARATVVVPSGRSTPVEVQVRPAQLELLRRRYAVAAEVVASFERGHPQTSTTAVVIDPSPEAGLKWARHLRGYVPHASVGPAWRLTRSVVVILGRSRGMYGPWSAICTGTKLRADGVGYPLVLTAAHCFRSLLQSVYGPGLAPIPPSLPIDDYVGLGDMDYAIADAGAPQSERTSAPVAIVDGIAVHFEAGPDIALVHARPEYTDVTVSGRRYQDIPAIVYRPVMTPPSIGSPSFADSAPVLSRRQTRAVGVYLGRRSDGAHMLDAVVVAPDGLDDDPCYYGGSGSLAVTADGSLLGPLSGRAADGYPDGQTVPMDSPLGKQEWSDRLGAALAVSAGVFDLDTICLYATPKPSQIAATSTAFSRYP